MFNDLATGICMSCVGRAWVARVKTKVEDVLGQASEITSSHSPSSSKFALRFADKQSKKID